MMIEINESSHPPFILNIDIGHEADQKTLDAIIDSGSPIFMIKENVVPPNLFMTPVISKLFGINKSQLKVLGVIITKVFISSISLSLDILFYVVDEGTMNSD